MELWNKKDLSHPPIITYRTTNQNIDLQHLSNVCKEIISFFEQNDQLRVEYAIMCRIVYRMKMKFRSAKDFKALEKVKRTLDNFFQVKLATIIKNFLDLIPARYNKKENYLPTKNLLDYILIKMQGIVKLFERTVETCKIAAHLLTERLHIGHFWKVAFIIFALLSRVFVLTKYSTRKICEFYGKLRPFSELLKNTGKDLLPENYSLPKELNLWLNVDWLEYDDDVLIVDETPRLPHIWDFMDLVDDDVEFCDEYYLIDDEEDDDEIKLVKDWHNKQQIKQKKIAENLANAEIIDLDKTLHQVSELKPKSIMRGFEQEDIGEVVSINDTIVSVTDDDSTIAALDESVQLVSSECEIKNSNKTESPIDVPMTDKSCDESVVFVKEFKKKTKGKKLLKNSPIKKKKNNLALNKLQNDDMKVKKLKKNRKKKLNEIEGGLKEFFKGNVANLNRESLETIPHVNIVSPKSIKKKKKKSSNIQNMNTQIKKTIEISKNKRKFNDISGSEGSNYGLSKSKKKRLKKIGKKM